MTMTNEPALDVPAHRLFGTLVRQQPTASYSFAGCAKDGSEGPPPKTPPPPPPSSDPVDIRELVEQIVRELTAGQMVVRVKPGAGFLGIERAPLEFVAPGAARISADRERRAFMVRYVDRGEVDENELPDVILEHALRLRGLSDAGSLESAGVYASGTGALQILLVSSRAEAERIASEDPLLSAGYFRGFEIDELLPSWIGDC